MDLIKIYNEYQRQIHSIYSSRLKVQILLTLISRDASLGHLRQVTGSTSQALIPKIRSLERDALIEPVEYGYSLTPFGKVVASNVEKYIQIIGGINRHKTFWATHDLSEIPTKFLQAIGDLYDTDTKQDTTTDMFSVYSHYLEILKDARYIHGLSSVASPGLAQFIGEKVVSGIPVELVISREVLELLGSEPYATNMHQLSGFENFVIWVTNEKLKVGLTVTEQYLSLGLYKKDTQLYDSATDLFSSDPKAVSWGESLFSYFRKRSEKLDIGHMFE